MSLKQILALGMVAGATVLAGCGSKPNSDEAVPDINQKCEVESRAYSLRIACEDPYLRFEARQVYTDAIQTQMNYHNSLGDTIELHGNMPENYDGTVVIYFFHVWDHYGFALPEPDENPTEGQKRLANRLSAKWLDNCRNANCIEEVAKWLETGRTPEERLQNRIGLDESLYSNPGVCQTNMRQRELAVTCDTPSLEFEGNDRGSSQWYTISYTNFNGEKVSIEARMPADYDTLPEIRRISTPYGGMDFLGESQSDEEARLVEAAGQKWLELCKLANCMEANADWFEYRENIQPGDAANLERRDFDEPFNNGRLTGYSIWQMVPNRNFVHEVTPRKTTDMLSMYSVIEGNSREYFDNGGDGSINLIHLIQRDPYSRQRFERGQEGTEAMFEAADAELAQAKKEMGTE